MKNRRKLFLVVITVLIMSLLGASAVMAASPKPNKVTKITASSKNIYVGQEFELEATTSPKKSNDNYLRWKIIGTSGIIKFADNDKNDDDVEFKALKAGTTKVRCYVNGKSNSYSKTFTVTVKKPEYKISRIGKAARTVEVGDEIELEVKKSGGTKDKHLKWTIKDTKLLKFDDGSKGDDVELRAKATGTTTVTCKNTETGKKVTYTITIVENTNNRNFDYDDYDDDDDDDD